MRAFMAALAGGLLFPAPRPAFSSDIKVSLEQGREPGAYRLAGEFAVEAGTAVIWGVLTDYDGIGSFVSSIKSSRVLRREPEAAVIEQEGDGRFLFFSRRVKLTLAVRENNPAGIDFRDLDGSQFKQYEGSWRISLSTGGCVVAYELTALPDPSLWPRFAARKTLRKNVQRQLEEVRVEIERRAGVEREERNR
jgi:hypothetical protein